MFFPTEATEKAKALHRTGRMAEAERLYDDILRQAPSNAEVLHLLGLLHYQTGRNERALELIGRAVGINPDQAKYTMNLGTVHLAMDKAGKALECYAKALEIEPGRADATFNAGNALSALGRHGDAARQYEKALELSPGDADIHYNLGVALQNTDDLEGAARHYFHAGEIAPEMAEAHRNLGVVLKMDGRVSEAVESLERAIALDPENVQLHNTYANALLLAGRYIEGWPEYEWRLKKVPSGERRTFPVPLWDGGDLNGKTIFLHTEQGFGDAIQFSRYARLVQERGGRVALECPAKLCRLSQGLKGVDDLIPMGGDLPAYDLHAPIMSLPGIFATTPETIPAEVPYLSAESPLVEKWRERLAAFPGLKVGLTWQGSTAYGGDHVRSLPLELFSPLAQNPAWTLFSLQKGEGDQIKKLGLENHIVDLTDEMDTGPDAFIDTAAMMETLDLVISCDTSTNHLAGALGRPFWALLNISPDWRWSLERTTSPWYPTARLFRQKTRGDWAGVLSDVEAALRNLPNP